MTDGHVVLIGPMGCGKSTVGRLVAEALGCDFIDNDTALELSTGMTARDIAARDGLDRLHAAELVTLDEMLDHGVPAVITAAASVIDSIERSNLAGQTVVYLHCSERAQSGRVGSGHHRPAIRLSPERVAYRDRRSRELADVVVDTSAIDPASAARVLLHSLVDLSK